MSGAEIASPSHAGPSRQLVFVLLDDFTLLPVAGALDALRLANRALGREAYRWRFAGEAGAGAEVSSSVGPAFRLDSGLEPLAPGEIALVCGGVAAPRHLTPALSVWLRTEAAKGAMLGALCTGAEVLAEAGLLDGRRATVHWERHDTLAAAHPAVELSRSVYVIDGERMTAAGGTASIDLMLALIAEDHGRTLARAVAAQQIAATIRTEADTQRPPALPQHGLSHPKLAAALAAMEAGLGRPLSTQTLAAGVGLSVRQLERLFRQNLGVSPKRYHLELRLRQARALLRDEGLSVVAAGRACGFASPSHFVRTYRAQYGTTPHRDRAAEPSAPPPA